MMGYFFDNVIFGIGFACTSYYGHPPSFVGQNELKEFLARLANSYLTPKKEDETNSEHRTQFDV
jgi:hypothetical protein